ncbi:MAG TPA: SDR family NAD(P)-dependent oxidoreductase [bacterium]|nr:SDR family NAD(P)-dependent oxidoreductase [bacterium]
MTAFETVFITGASAGIGAALARAYAAPGCTLGLVARRVEQLERVKQELEGRGARVLLYQADVRDAEQMANAAKAFCSATEGVSLAIANAGTSHSDRLDQGSAAPGTETIAINVIGTINTLLPLVPAMMAQRRGHLVAIGSVAGFRGLPHKGAYSASKAAVKTLLDGYRPVLRPYGIRCTTICPGYVETELTAKNKFPMPFLMPADRAARLIQGAINQGKSTYVFPWQMRALIPLLQRVPDRWLPGNADL